MSEQGNADAFRRVAKSWVYVCGVQGVLVDIPAVQMSLASMMTLFGVGLYLNRDRWR